MSGNNGNKNRSGEIGLGRDEFFFSIASPLKSAWLATTPKNSSVESQRTFVARTSNNMKNKNNHSTFPLFPIAGKFIFSP